MKKTFSSFAAVLAWMFAGVVSAQTTTVATTTATSTPGVPNTGTGDILTNVIILALSAAVAVAAAAYLYATRPQLD